ncbi:TIGR01777 family oxidoreductase [Salisediminibacterium beveridgei]|uniref:Multidrug MFS transporter n=1 Tax=Salisediminibacterium beveridgei TaxID=632773 RepID=A0A1D7QXC0_9BACI|nr:TIGR01777 family oxidoreductase [Salisediminibacterium beveridgei]AOM83652.1 multidrug MFS transporter [Salisediminibacterium beveridgei]
MKIAISGGSGLIGKALTKELTDAGHEVFILTRSSVNREQEPHVQYVRWLSGNTYPERELEGIDAFVNLAGENLNEGRWTEAKKERILKSRLQATRETVRILHSLNKKPEVLINGSAVGIYGTSYSRTFTEEDMEPGEDFLADVVSSWEEAAEDLPEETRLVYSRFGVVLSTEGGALKKMLPAFQLYAGGKLGTGEQWMSWIHLQDVAKGLKFLIDNKEIYGPVNFTAPNPEKMKHFGKTLSGALGKPFWAPVPSVMLKAILGEMSVLVLEGQKVLPQKLTDNGYKFAFPHLNEAFDDLLQ